MIKMEKKAWIMPGVENLPIEQTADPGTANQCPHGYGAGHAPGKHSWNGVGAGHCPICCVPGIEAS